MNNGMGLKLFKLGAGGAVGAVVAVKVADKMFTSETDATKRETNRGLVEIGVGLAGGYALKNVDREFAVGFAGGAIGHGAMRVAKARNYFSLGTAGGAVRVLPSASPERVVAQVEEIRVPRSR